MSLVAKKFSDIITFTRASNATRTGPTGLIEYAPHNLLLQSQTFDNAVWVTSNASVIMNTAVSPSGSVDADKLIENTATIDHIVYQPFIATSAAYTVSVFVKAAERSLVAIRLDNAVTLSTSYFDLSTGTVAVSGPGATCSITAIGNGWYRCGVTRTLAASTFYLVVSPSLTTSGNSYTGDGTSGIYLWGAQLTVGPSALDYTPTTTTAVYGPRFDYDPVTLAPKGLLIEEARTNLLTYSEQFDNAAWTKYMATVTANAVLAPSGTITAAAVVENTANDQHQVQQFKAGFVAGQTWTLSFFAKTNGRNVQGSLSSTIFGGSSTKYDLTDGVIISTQASSAAIVPVGGEWYRCSLTATAHTSGSANGFAALLNGANTVYAGDGTSGVYLWGAQLEQGAFATSYIPTAASTVTRSVDNATINTLSPWYNQTEGSLYAEVSTFGLGGGAGPYVVEFNDGTSSNRILVYLTGANGKLHIVTGGVAQAIATTSGVANNIILRIASAIKSADFAQSVNGVSPVVVSSGTLPVVSVMPIGRYNVGASNYINGHIRRIAYYPRRLSNADLQAITA